MMDIMGREVLICVLPPSLLPSSYPPPSSSSSRSLYLSLSSTQCIGSSKDGNREPPFRCTQPCCRVLWLELDRRLTHFHSKTQCCCPPPLPFHSLSISLHIPSLVCRGGPIRSRLVNLARREHLLQFLWRHCSERAGEPFATRLWLSKKTKGGNTDKC